MISIGTLGLPGLSPLATFNSWVLSLAALRNGEMESPALHQEFSRFLHELHNISNVFRSEMRYQEREGPWKQWLEEALLALEDCEDRTYLLCEALEGDRWENATEARVIEIAEALKGLFGWLDRMREAEAQRPRLAQSPYLHEILRCADLYDREVLSGELMTERLASCSHHFQLVRGQLQASSVRLPAQEQMLDLLDQLEDTLQKLLHQAAEEQPLGVHELEKLKECDRQAQEIHQEVVQVAGQPALWCSACQGFVPAAETCPDCGAPLVSDAPAVLGLVELARRMSQEARDTDWPELRQEVQKNLNLLQETLLKARHVEHAPMPLVPPLQRLNRVLYQILECEDQASLRSLVGELEEALEQATELHHQIAHWVEAEPT